MLGVSGLAVAGCWFVHTPVHGERDQRHAQADLYVHDLEGMDGRHGKCSRLLVLVMQLVEVLVQEGSVVRPVNPVRHVVLQGNIIATF